MSHQVEQHRVNLDHYAKKVHDLQAAAEKAKAKSNFKENPKDVERLQRNVSKHEEAAAEYEMWAQQTLAAIQVGYYRYERSSRSRGRGRRTS